jgi:hypothetical protein
MTLAVLATLLVLLNVLPSGCLEDGDEEEEEERTLIEPIEAEHPSVGVSEMTVKVINSLVNVSTWRGDAFKMTGQKWTKMGQTDLDEMEVFMNASGDLVTVEEVHQGRCEGVHVAIDLMVPSGIHVSNVTAVNGRINIDSLAGTITLNNVNGAIQVLNLNGSVNATSTNGAIELVNVQGSFSARTSNGDISADIEHVDGNITLWTENGAIDVWIKDTINVNLLATSEMGAITHGNLDMELDTDTSTRVEGRLGDGGCLVRLRSARGAISINKM